MAKTSAARAAAATGLAALHLQRLRAPSVAVSDTVRIVARPRAGQEGAGKEESLRAGRRHFEVSIGAVQERRANGRRGRRRCDQATLEIKPPI